MSFTLGAWQADLVEDIRRLVNPHGDGPVTVSDDPRNLGIPGVWVGLVSATPTLGDVWTVEWSVVVLGSTSGPREASRQLGVAASPILAAYGLADPAQGVEALTITEPNISAEAIPAIRFTITTECEE